jgi:hypothetical protein
LAAIASFLALASVCFKGGLQRCKAIVGVADKIWISPCNSFSQMIRSRAGMVSPDRSGFEDCHSWLGSVGKNFGKAQEVIDNDATKTDLLKSGVLMDLICFRGAIPILLLNRTRCESISAPKLGIYSQHQGACGR